MRIQVFEFWNHPCEICGSDAARRIVVKAYQGKEILNTFMCQYHFDRFCNTMRAAKISADDHGGDFEQRILPAPEHRDARRKA